MRKELENDLATGVDPGFHWHYDDGGWPLIARYDPEGWDARWAAEDAAFEAASETAVQQDALIEQVNQRLDEDEWYAASEIAYEALWLAPNNFRSANALLRCYLHRDALREMERAQFCMFHPEDPDYDTPHQRRRRLQSRSRHWRNSMLSKITIQYRMHSNSGLKLCGGMTMESDFPGCIDVQETVR